MASSSAATVKEYIASLPADRRKAVEKVRKVVRANLPPGYKEGMLYGMISYYVPFTLLPDTYNGQPLGIAGIASQKGHLSLYLMCVYGSPHLRSWFEDGFRKAGKRLDMGKSCIRFRSADDLPLDLIGEAIAKVSVDEFIAIYRASREGLASGSRKRARPAAASSARKGRTPARAKAKPRARARA